VSFRLQHSSFCHIVETIHIIKHVQLFYCNHTGESMFASDPPHAGFGVECTLDSLVDFGTRICIVCLFA